MPPKDTPTDKAMLDAVCQTFETMAFAQVTEQSAELELEVGNESIWSSILVHDPVQGEIQMALPQALLTKIAADMFGIEQEEVNESQLQDIIAEILNTLAGLFMTSLLPDDQTYKLGLPEHGTGPLPEIETESIVWKLQIEGLALLLVAVGSGFRV